MRSGGSGNGRVTHLIGSVDLRGGPSSVLHVVLLHLGTDFGTGSDVTCRLGEKEKNKGGEIGKTSTKHENVFFFCFFT